MNCGMISVLAVALSLGTVTAGQAEDWTGANLTFGLSAASLDMRDRQVGGLLAAAGESLIPAERDVSPYLAAGYDWRFGELTLGVVGDIDFTSVENGDLLSSGKGTYAEANWFATLRGKIGVPLNDQLRLTASGGVAMMRVDATHVDITGFSFETGYIYSVQDVGSRTLTGPAVGLSLDYAVAPKRHLTVEYLYADFGQVDNFTGGGEGDASISPIVSTVRMGYTFRF